MSEGAIHFFMSCVSLKYALFWREEIVFGEHGWRLRDLGERRWPHVFL